MFDAVRNNKKIVQVFLVLIALPFAFFGVESFRDGGAGVDVAKVGEVKISQQEFQQAVREQQDRLRGQLGELDPKVLDNPEFRQAILDDLIDQRLLFQEARKRHLFASDDAVRQAIMAVEAFQDNGQFSQQRYEALLSAQGMSPAGFEAQVRQDLALQQLAGTIGRSGIVSQRVTDKVLALQSEARHVQEFVLPVENYVAKVKLEDGAAKKFYDENTEQFRTPDQAKVEYVVLTPESLAVEVSEAEIKAWYDGHKERYQQPEERRASHILIAAEKLGKDKARQKAEEVLREVQAKPAAFAELARKHSDDPGSASQGGDLGFFGRGMMVKPFEDATFALRDGEVSGIVESDFGFHIIKLTGQHVAREKPLAEVRGEIERELKSSAVARKFAEAAESFSNMVYEQSDSLQPVADQFKLKIQRSDWIGREANPAAGVLGNAKLLAAVFSDDTIQNKRNTEAVEVAQNTLVAARIAEYQPASVQPLAGLQATIEKLLVNQEAQKLARADGEARLAALQSGTDKLAWGADKVVSRMDARLLPPQAAPLVFRMDKSKLPGYAGVDLPGKGYALYRLSKVTPGAALDTARRQGLQGQLRSLAAQQEVAMYLSALRARYKVDVNEKALASSSER
ncbi:SurA N-terminal domain-containing protein [Azonexus hydrophilus]|uniref:SurA N-terminal domain-containing protein n=1 Tax=Azonexus hydrophilus TaxID=418702 RepID=UPI0019665B58|nr:SurA N-terminal domain-containing protein [Azonexus hydrophilus]